MTLPVVPDARTVLQRTLENLRDVVLPGVHGEWEHFCGTLLIGSIEYAMGLLDGDRGAAHRVQLAEAVQSTAPAIADDPDLALALAADSPYEAATMLLVWSQRNPGERADRIRAHLRPVLLAQLDTEMKASMPVMIGLGQAMRGRRD